MKPPNSIPSAAEFGELRAFLAKKKVSQADINAAIGENVGGRTRAEITNKLIEWLRGLL
jgi:hypothetical protein